MATKTMVDWVNSVKECHGTNVESVMEAHLIKHQASAQHAAQQTIAFGLMTDCPTFLDEFKELGGDVDYLLYVADCFLKVRSKYFGL